jgi:hypothetical protein
MTCPARRTFLADMVRFTAALPLIDWSRDMAQQRLPRIGFMSGAEPSLISSFEDEMRKLGYSPGKNIHIETVSAGRIRTTRRSTRLNSARWTWTLSSSPRCRSPDDAAGEPQDADGDYYVPRNGE